MDKLRKHFSAQFVNLVAKSEIALADIEKLYRWGYKILPGNFTCGGEADIDNKVIRVGRCKLICRMVILFHEVGHVLNSRDKSMKKVSPHRSTVGQYVLAEIRDEYRSWRYAVNRVCEIYADRPRMKHHFNEWAKLLKAGKWAQMFREIRAAEITTSKSKPFEKYWADTYKKEKLAAAKKRKQTRESNKRRKTQKSKRTGAKRTKSK